MIVKNVFKNVTNGDQLWETVKNCETLLKKCFKKLDGYSIFLFYLNIEKLKKKNSKSVNIVKKCKKFGLFFFYLEKIENGE